MTPEPHDPETVEMSPEEQAEFLRAVEESLADTRPSVPFSKVKKWLLSWGTDSVLPRPE
jgi:hypothetical protein